MTNSIRKSDSFFYGHKCLVEQSYFFFATFESQVIKSGFIVAGFLDSLLVFHSYLRSLGFGFVTASNNHWATLEVD